MVHFRRLVRRVRQAIRPRKVPKLDPRLAAMERVFHAPPLTRELVAAIKLISPQLDFTTHEKYRAFWEAEQNGVCWGEYEALAPLFCAMPKPAKILEIGPGMGRSIVFFSKKLGWEDGTIHAYEGEGNSTRYTLLGPRFDDSFCGNLGALRYVLEHNGIHNATLFDAGEVPLDELPGPYDLLYSFYSIGFHWALEHFLDDLLPLLHDRSVAVFTIPKAFEPFPKLAALPYRIVNCKTVWPPDSWLRLLVLSKSALPNWT